MALLRPRFTVVLTTTAVTAAASPLTLIGIARVDDVQGGAQPNSQSGSFWVSGTTLTLTNSKSVEILSVSASALTSASSMSEQTKTSVLSSEPPDTTPTKSGGWYGIIDGGEDADLSDGFNPYYLVRSGTTAAMNTSTEWLLR